MSRQLSFGVMISLFAPLAGTSPALGAEHVVLLVHGLQWDLNRPDDTWGEFQNGRWSGMIGALEQRGLRYGGEIRPGGGTTIDFSKHLQTRGVVGKPREASLFVLSFSRAANTDGLAHRVLELAETVKRLQDFTGAKRISLVAFSAGGLVCRGYLQDALPGVKYEGGVDRLITMATPHMGAAVTENFGDLLGTRATALKPNADLIVDLNQRRELPTDVKFASLVIRGMGADARGDGHRYRAQADLQKVARLPMNYREGGDQVLHVVSQNLTLSRCAAIYEKKTNRPVLCCIVRVADPTPEDRSLTETKVHEVIPFDREVQRWVGEFLHSDYWNLAGDRKDAWRTRQARQSAESAVEEACLRRHPLCEVQSVELTSIQIRDRGAGVEVEFGGLAHARGNIAKKNHYRTAVTGTLDLSYDRFDRLESCRTQISSISDLK